MSSIDILVAGLTTIDIAMCTVDHMPEIDTGMLVETIRFSPAGTAAGAALVAARLGLDVALIGAVGDDLQGDTVRLGLERAGVQTAMLARLAGIPTSTTVLPVRKGGQRSTYHMPGASHHFGLPAAAFEALPDVRAIHWGGVNLAGLAGQGAAFLRQAKAHGAFITCDLISPRAGALDDLTQLLPYVDLFMPSLAEVRILAGIDDLAAAAQVFIGLGAKACLFKIGREGAVLMTGETQLRVPAFAIEPVDTTSCGDSFCAGFHAARLADLPMVDCLRFAAATAARVAQGVGTLGALSDFADTLQFARTCPQIG